MKKTISQAKYLLLNQSCKKCIRYTKTYMIGINEPMYCCILQNKEFEKDIFCDDYYENSPVD